jgi:uncharacterized membrane protein YbhN (UPF0104 family)
MTVTTRRVVRVIGSLALLGGALWMVDLPSVLSRFGALRPGWAAIAVALTLGQTVASAWRWRFTAHRLGIDLGGSAALGEYYLAAFLNQVVPGGVVGDVSRAVRHARGGDEPPGRRAIHAVILERASGQLVVVLAAGVSIGALYGPLGAASAALGAAVLLAVAVRPLRRSVRRVGAERPFLRDLDRGLLAPGVFTVQLATSLCIVGSYVATYVVAARAIGVNTPALLLLPLVMPVLLSMLLPVSVAGWGVREAAAGAIWASAGLAAAEGVAISLAYGVLVLIGTLPGALVLARSGLRRGVSRSPEDRGRRAGPSRVEDAAPAVGAPRPAGRSREG